MNWLKIKCLRYEKLSPGIIYYRYGYAGEYKIINVMEIVVDESQTIDLSIFQRGMMRSYPISKDKKRDLFSKCEKYIYPLELNNWYQNLPVSETVRNVVPEPSEIDSDFETEQ